MKTQRMLRALTTITLGVTLVLTASCSGSSGRSGSTSVGTGSAVAGSTAGGSGGTAVGPLLRKALDFHRTNEPDHTPDGLLFCVGRAPSGQVQSLSQEQSACIWTGIYVAAQAERYRVTGDPDALATMERSLRALIDLHDITGFPGFICRSMGRPPAYRVGNAQPGTGQYAGFIYNSSGTSRDQYTGWMLGAAMAWPHIQSPALRADLQRVVRSVAELLMRNDLKLMAPNEHGQIEAHFNLNPDGGLAGRTITAQEWSRIDDFPINLLVQAVPYDPLIVSALQNATYPPVRAGEALRALFFIKTAAVITGDAAIDDYYRNVLLGQKDFLSVVHRYGTIQDDLFRGRNLHEIETILVSLGQVMGDVMRAVVQARMGRFGGILGSFAVRLAQPVINWAMRFIARRISSAISYLNSPNGLQTAQRTVAGLQMLGNVMSALGMGGAARSLQNFAGNLAPYANSTLEDARWTMSSGVGSNISWSALYGLCELETDPNIASVYRGLVDRKHDYTRRALSSYFNFIHAGYSPTGPDQAAVAQGIDSLQRHPASPLDHAVDNTGLPGVRVSPWPDRFGRVGRIALDAFPLDRRGTHHYIWQQHPGQISSGSNGSEERTGLGYLIAYWLGRRVGVIDSSW